MRLRSIRLGGMAHGGARPLPRGGAWRRFRTRCPRPRWRPDVGANDATGVIRHGRVNRNVDRLPGAAAGASGRPLRRRSSASVWAGCRGRRRRRSRAGLRSGRQASSRPGGRPCRWRAGREPARAGETGLPVGGGNLDHQVLVAFDDCVDVGLFLFILRHAGYSVSESHMTCRLRCQSMEAGSRRVDRPGNGTGRPRGSPHAIRHEGPQLENCGRADACKSIRCFRMHRSAHRAVSSGCQTRSRIWP